MTADTQSPRSLSARALRAFKLGAQALPTSKDGLVVASFGRAGSTLVYDALAEGMARHRFGRESDTALRIVKDGAFDLGAQTLRPGVVYKTHDYPEILAGRSNLRAVFLFGSAVDAALSVHAQKEARSEAWVREHFEHLRRPYRYDELLKEDVLGFRDQCVAWMGFEEIPVLCLRYEGLWDNAETISEFCGLDVRLPERRARAPKQVDPELLATVQEVYGPIDEDLAKLPDCFTAAPEYGARMRGSTTSPDTEGTR